MTTDFFYAKLFPVRTTQFILDWAHDYAPFWLVVLTVPWLTKGLLILPMIVWQQRKWEAVAHRIPQAMTDYAYLHNLQKRAKDKSDTQLKSKAQLSQEYDAQSKALKAKYGFNPYTQQFKQLVPALNQIPIHMSLFVATRTMYPAYPDWKQGGAVWFTDLSVGDPFYIWPALSATARIASGWAMFRNAEFQAKFPSLPMNQMLYATTGV